MTNQLQKSILQTLAFFDIFEHPLTCQELYRMLLTYGFPDNPDLRINFTEFLERLRGIDSKDGFYFLPGREAIVEERQRRVKIIEQKMRIAVRGIKKLRWAPFVRAVFVCNTTAMGIADEESDTDVFIIAKKGRIWLARFLATLILSLFGLRRTKKKIKNKICLSFYVTDNNLNLEPIALKQPDLSGAALAEPDVYLIYWVDSLIPVYDPENFFEKIQEANQWVKKYLPNGLREYVVGAYCNTPIQRIKKLFEKMWGGRYGDIIEAQAKAIQRAKMKMNLQSRQSEATTAVVVSDEMLKFHENDRRMEYKNKWGEKCRKLI